MGYQFGRTGELRVGYEGGWQNFERQIGNPNELPSFSGGYGATRLQYKLDRLDDPVIPRAGQSLPGRFSMDERQSGSAQTSIRCSKSLGRISSG